MVNYRCGDSAIPASDLIVPVTRPRGGIVPQSDIQFLSPGRVNSYRRISRTVSLAAALSSCLILGAGLLLATFGRQARRIATMLATSVVFITSLSLIGYWFGADELFGVARYTGIAWQSSTMLAALGIGLMAALPRHGI